MAELEHVGGRAGAALVVDVDRGDLAACSESTRTIGRPARRTSSISGWSSVRPIATTPSTVARWIAREREPWSGEMKWSP